MTKKQIILSLQTCVAVAALGLSPAIFNQINPYIGIVSGLLSFIFIILFVIKIAKTQ